VMSEFNPSARFASSRGGSFSRGRGGAGMNRGDDYPRQSESGAYGMRNPSVSQQNESGFNTSAAQDFQDQQTGFARSRGGSFSRGRGGAGANPVVQDFQPQQTGLSQGQYNSSTLLQVRSEMQDGSQTGFNRSHGAGSSFQTGQQGVGGAVHSMGGQGLAAADANEEWRRKQEEVLARNMNVVPPETPAKKPPVLVKEVEPQSQISRGGPVMGVHPVQERFETLVKQQPQKEVTPTPQPARQPSVSVQTQSVPNVGGSAGGVASFSNASSDDLEQIAEIVGMMAEAFNKLHLFLKTKK